MDLLQEGAETKRRETGGRRGLEIAGIKSTTQSLNSSAGGQNRKTAASVPQHEGMSDR